MIKKLDYIPIRCDHKNCIININKKWRIKNLAEKQTWMELKSEKYSCKLPVNVSESHVVSHALFR